MSIVRRYYVNYYGRDRSQLQQGLESDRVIAEWWIDQPRIPVRGRRATRLHSIRHSNAEEAKSEICAGRAAARREQFLKNFQDDYFVAGFERNDEWSEYLFIPGASRVHQAD